MSSRVTENLGRRQNIPVGRVLRTQSDNVSYASLQKDFFEIESVDIPSYRLKRDQTGKSYCVYAIAVVMKSGTLFCYTPSTLFNFNGLL